MAKKSIADYPHLQAKMDEHRTKNPDGVPSWARSTRPDNGLVHYGSGLPGSICGVHSPTRKEKSENRGITCPHCKSILRTRP